MLDPGIKKTPNKPHALLSDLIKLESDDAGSGASTPPLWRPESPETRRKNYAAMSPRSRAEAVSRGQMELMEMAKNMSESCYELSLKDIVDANRVNLSQQDQRDRDGKLGRRDSLRTQHRQRGRGQMVRSGSLDGSSGGFLLKMVLPVVPWGSRKNKKKKIGGLDASSGNNGVSTHRTSDKEWWKSRSSSLPADSARGESVGSGTDSSSLGGSRKSSIGSSSRSNSSGRRWDVESDCWPFIRRSKSQN